MSGAGRRVGAEFEFDFDANVHRSNPLKVRGRSRRWAIGIVRHAQDFELRAHSSTYPVYGARLLLSYPILGKEFVCARGAAHKVTDLRASTL